MVATAALTNPFGGALFLVGIVIVVSSPRKLRTLGRMVAAFLIVAVVLLVVGAVLRTGDPEMFGALAVDVAMGAADAVGVLHIRSLRRRVPP
jgi:O-antigen ligase